MKAVAWMAGASVIAWLIAWAAVGRTSASGLVLRDAGPPLIASASWVMAERTYRRDPRALTGLLITAFAFKLVFFGGYVAVMLRVLAAAAGAVRSQFQQLFHRVAFRRGVSTCSASSPVLRARNA